MIDLSVEEFSAFMEEVTGHTPFPWQVRLLEQVVSGEWPELLDLPTGTGKTSVLYVALFALALHPELHHRRIALVVDRHIIVDQTHDVARRLQAALLDEACVTARRVGRRLQALSADPTAEPVEVVHLRGGIPRDDGWLRRPDQATILVSTVDQVGSRLLFRGYGVTPCMRPVHAGILSHDTLYLLDEVHLAAAFEETLSTLSRTYGSWEGGRSVGRRFQVVRMSATPGTDTTRAFSLGAADREHPILGRRLRAGRLATLNEVKTRKERTREDGAENRIRVARDCVDRAGALLKEGVTTIAIVVNRVDTSRRAARLVADRLPGAEVMLITGRMRPFERAALQQRLSERVGVGAVAEDDARPLVVVATSCIEAGADLDFDGMVAEAATLDALRQRIGRLNRIGRRESAPVHLVARTDQIADTAGPDPVYGTALRETWRYLKSVATGNSVDFGLDAFPDPESDRLPTLLPDRVEAPVLLPLYMDLWSETRPSPHPDPDPSLWLHGKDSGPQMDVSVVFRAGLPAPDTESNVVLRATEILEFVPPVADEAVAVEVGKARRWLGATEDRHVWRWTADGVESIAAGALRPGDTVVVPAERGGLYHGTWDPDDTDPVLDVGEEASYEARGWLRLRLEPGIFAGPGPEAPRPSTADPEALDVSREKLHTWLEALAEHADDTLWPGEAVRRSLARGKPRSIVGVTADGSPAWWVAWDTGVAFEATTEDAVSSFSGVEVGLLEHLSEVAEWARAFGTGAGLAEEVVDDVALAARLHDMGKADRRFQALLHGGDPVRAAVGDPIAKSRISGSAATRRRARERSGWPEGFRHELVSLALLDASPELQERAHDIELVRHLVASHHGWCRPWPPALVDANPVHVELSMDGLSLRTTTQVIDDEFLAACVSRFRRLCRRYGWHGLAHLEAILRLADHRASANPGTIPRSIL